VVSASARQAKVLGFDFSVQTPHIFCSHICTLGQHKHNKWRSNPALGHKLWPRNSIKGNSGIGLISVVGGGCCDAIIPHIFQLPYKWLPPKSQYLCVALQCRYDWLSVYHSCMKELGGAVVSPSAWQAKVLGFDSRVQPMHIFLAIFALKDNTGLKHF
jgi:hypothetical protein